MVSAHLETDPGARGFAAALPSGHRDGNEGQQEHQHAAGHRQHDGHGMDDAFHAVRGLLVRAMAVAGGVIGHGGVPGMRKIGKGGF